VPCGVLGSESGREENATKKGGAAFAAAKKNLPGGVEEIAQMNRAAAAEGLTYGQYAAKHKAEG